MLVFVLCFSLALGAERITFWPTSIVLSVLVPGLVAWCVGTLHIHLVEPKWVGKLTRKQFVHRAWLFGGTFIVPITLAVAFVEWGGVPRFSPSKTTISLAIASAALLVMTLGISYHEIHWWRRHGLNRNTLRVRTFKFIALPILYGCLSVYWIVLTALWLFFLQEQIRPNLPA